MLNEYGEDYKRDFSITLTTTTSKQDEINLLSSKSFFTNFTIEYLMKRKFIEIAKKLKSKHVLNSRKKINSVCNHGVFGGLNRYVLKTEVQFPLRA